MKFENYITEATNGIFSQKKIDKVLLHSGKKYTIIEVGTIDNFDIWSTGKSIIKSKPFSKGKFYSKVMDDKGNTFYLIGGSAATPPGKFDMSWESSPTGRLKIETTMVLKSYKTTEYKTPILTFPAYVFDNTNDIVKTVCTGFENINGMPKNVVETIKFNMKKPFSDFDWHTITNSVERNEISVYFGEILVALSLLNDEMSVFKGNFIPNGEKVAKVIFPSNPSFHAVDSIIETNKGTIIKISSKKGKGAAASLYGNVISHIIEFNIDVNGMVLSELISSCKGFDLKRNVIGAMYNWAFNHTNIFKGVNMSPLDFKNELVLYNKNGESGYTKQFDIVSDNIRKNSWNHFTGKKLTSLPFSISHWISGEMADRLNNDKKSMSMILRVLGEENYYQVSLDPNFVKTGKARYTVKHSGSNNIKILPSRAVFSDPSLSQAKINYEIY